MLVIEHQSKQKLALTLDTMHNKGGTYTKIQLSRARKHLDKTILSTRQLCGQYRSYTFKKLQQDTHMSVFITHWEADARGVYPIPWYASQM